MNEGITSNENKDTAPGEKEVRKLGEGLEKVGEQLEKIDPSKITPEQFKALEGKVEMIFAVMAAYTGAQLLSWGLTTDGPLNPTFIDYITRAVKVAIGGGIGMTFIGVGWFRLCEGLKKFVKNTPRSPDGKFL